MGTVPNCPPAEDMDMLSATNSEVESAMNHRRRRAVLRDPIFSAEAFNSFNSGDTYISAAQDGHATATDQYVKDIRVRESYNYVYQLPLRLETVDTTDLRIIVCIGSYVEEYLVVSGARGVKSPAAGRSCRNGGVQEGLIW